jgi:DHA1 family multidrug resistance protein-like MFS transporter
MVSDRTTPLIEQAGPVLGSMLGYWILYGGWRWTFWTITFLAAINLILIITLMRETYAP